MSIETDSEKWESGRNYDWPREYVYSFLEKNEGKAYTVEEIAENLLDEEPGIVPQPLRKEQNSAALYSYITVKLDELYWRNFIDFKCIDEGDTETLYYTKENKDWILPMAKVQDEFPQKLSKLDSETDSLEEKTDKVEERLSRISYELRERFDIWV